LLWALHIVIKQQFFYIYNYIQLLTSNQLQLFTRTTEVVCNDVLSATDITYCESIGLQSQTQPHEAWILCVA